jgi:small-conductance mechanosensitive channel
MKRRIKLGLYINDEDHPSVFKNEKNIDAPNQHYKKYNYMTELIEEQKEANLELIQSIQDFNKLYKKQEKKHNIQWNNMDSQMKDLKIRNDYLTEYGSQIVERLYTLDAKYKQLETILEKDNQMILDQLTNLKEFDQEISNRLQKYEEANKHISVELSEQMEMQKEVSNQLSNQKEFQEEVVKRLDNQEVLAEKMARQLNHIRSILFERTNYLVEKIEEGYKITSSYVYKLMNGTDQPLTFTLLNNKKEEEKK